MFEGIVQTISNPLAFFRSLQDDDKLAGGAVLVVLLVALLSAGVGYFSALPSTDAFPDDIPFRQFGLIAATLGSVMVTFISWLVNGLLVRMSAGMDSKPWAIVGYAMSPLLIIYLLIIVLAAIFPVNLVPISVGLDDPEAFQQAVQQTQKAYQATIFGRSTQLLGYASSLWWIILIFLGVREAKGTNKAYIAAGLVTLLTLAFTVGPLLLQRV